jgi:KDO2-lipid IV(A) lauroyltransferase
LALPHLSDKERVVMRKKSYTIYDMFMEMIKTGISSKKMNKRFVITNIELINEQKKKHHAFSLPCKLGSG